MSVALAHLRFSHFGIPEQLIAGLSLKLLIWETSQQAIVSIFQDGNPKSAVHSLRLWRHFCSGTMPPSAVG